MYGDITEIFEFFAMALLTGLGICLVIGFTVWAVFMLIAFFKDASSA